MELEQTLSIIKPDAVKKMFWEKLLLDLKMQG
jgi:nucleoside diphosphate kinase